METIGKWVVDRLDFRIVDHVLVGVEDALDVTRGREVLRSSTITRGYRHQAVSGIAGRAHDRRVTDTCCTEYADSQRFHGAQP